MKKFYLLLFISLFTAVGYCQVTTESFSNIPSTPINSYFTVNWTGDNGLPWTSTDTRIDTGITAGNKAITIRNGTMTCANIPNGINTLSFKNKQIFTGSGSVLQVMINGTTIGTTNPTTTVATATFSNINVSGTFTLAIKQATSGLRIAIDDIQWTSKTTTACVAPTAQPTNLTFSGITTSNINGSFTAASPVADEYLIVRSISNSLGASPANGTVYSTGDGIGNGTVVSRGSGTTFSDGSLNPATTYYYFVYSLSSSCTGGPIYNNASPLVGNTPTATPIICAAPVGNVSNVQFTSVSGTSINGSFTAAPDADGYLICISTDPLAFTPINGTTYASGTTVGNGTVVDFAQGTTFSKTGLSVSTQYYFTFFPANSFTCTGGPLYNTTGFSASTTTTAGGSGIPTGYYSTITSSDNCATLKSKLNTIVSTGINFKTYADLYTQYAISDLKPREVGTGSTNVIWDIYSDVPGPSNDPYNFTPVTQEDHGSCGSGEGSCYNREHSVPLSWFNGNTGTPSTGATDYNFIFPTDKLVNANRSNYVYGEVATSTNTSLNGSKLGASAVAGINGTVFEPINEYKGDVARAFLYFVTRYQSTISTYPGTTPQPFDQATNSGTFPSVEINYLKVMLKWASQDPVSQKEIDRNNATYSFQNNRNPYIDHPEYVDMVWNSTCSGLSALPVDIIFFKGNLVGANVQLQWEVENESNLLEYDIERSVNGIDFSKVGFVTATGKSNYAATDDVSQLTGRRLYYRLKKLDKDGKFTYSAIFSLHVPLQLMFSVYPNPVVSSTLTVQLGKTVSTDAKLFIVDAIGKIVLQQSLPTNIGSFTVNTNNLPSGSYLIRLVDNGQQQVQRIVVMK